MRVFHIWVFSIIGVKSHKQLLWFIYSEVREMKLRKGCIRWSCCRITPGSTLYEAKHSPEHEPELSYIHSNTLFTPDVWLFLHKIIRAQMFKCFSAGLIYERLLLLYSFCITFILNRLNIIKSHFHFFYTLSAKDKMAAISKKRIKKKTARYQFKVAIISIFLFHLRDFKPVEQIWWARFNG